MQTQTKRQGLVKGSISGGIEAISDGKPETGCAHAGATLGTQATPTVSSSSKDQIEQPRQEKTLDGAAAGPHAEEQNAVGLNHLQRLLALERHLQRPFPHPTEFYVIDRIDRMTGDSGSYAGLDEIIEESAQPESICPFRLGMVLSHAVRAGALQKSGPTTGREGSYRTTDTGRRYLDQAKAMRVALWKVNPSLSIAEICAIVQIEGSDALSEMVARGKDEEALKAKRLRQEKRETQKRASMGQGKDQPVPPPSTTPSPPQNPIHPLWNGLIARPKHQPTQKP